MTRRPREATAPTMLGAVARPFKRVGWKPDNDAPEGQVWLDAPRLPGRWGRVPARLMLDYSRAQVQLVTFDTAGHLARRMTFSPVDADTYQAVAAFLTVQAAQAGATVPEDDAA